MAGPGDVGDPDRRRHGLRPRHRGHHGGEVRPRSRPSAGLAVELPAVAASTSGPGGSTADGTAEHSEATKTEKQRSHNKGGAMTMSGPIERRGQSPHRTVLTHRSSVRMPPAGSPDAKRADQPASRRKLREDQTSTVIERRRANHCRPSSTSRPSRGPSVSQCAKCAASWQTADPVRPCRSSDPFRSRRAERLDQCQTCRINRAVTDHP